MSTHLTGSNEYTQSMFLSKYQKSNVYSCTPQFYYIKVGLKGVKIIYACFRDVSFGQFLLDFKSTVDSLYLEVQGTLLNSFDLSVPRYIRFAELRKK